MIGIKSLSAVALLLATPVQASLIAQDGDTFTFTQGYSEVHGFTAKGTPYSITYYTSEQVDKLWWTPCDLCVSDDGPIAMLVTPPSVVMPNDMLPSPSSTGTPLSTVPLPSSMYLLIAAIGVLAIRNMIGAKQ